MFCSNTRLMKLYCNYKRLYLQNNTPKIEELKVKQRDEIAQLSAHNVSLQKKCEKFKDMIRSLNEKTQSDDLMSYGMEISRLNGKIASLKRFLNSTEQGPGRFMNRQRDLQTPQDGRTHLGYLGTM